VVGLQVSALLLLLLLGCCLHRQSWVLHLKRSKQTASSSRQ
jgi:hypothetical protein